jgi:hypothetical protein
MDLMDKAPVTAQSSGWRFPTILSNTLTIAKQPDFYILSGLMEIPIKYGRHAGLRPAHDRNGGDNLHVPRPTRCPKLGNQGF